MLNILKLLILTTSALPLTLATAESPEAPKTNPSYGLTVVEAVEVCDPKGEREYLQRLVCPSGDRPTFQREGSVGPRNSMDNLTEAQAEAQLAKSLGGAELEPGETDYHVIDGYEVSCKDSKTTVYLDMYHCSNPAPSTAPQGFTIIE